VQSIFGSVINRSKTDNDDDDFGDDKEKEGVGCSYKYHIHYVGGKRKFTVLKFHRYKKEYVGKRHILYTSQQVIYTKLIQTVSTVSL